MTPTPVHQDGRQSSADIGRSGQSSRGTEKAIQSVDTVQRLRSEESWVEISSQPSSSSLSSIGDEIVTTGLRVQPGSNSQRRRRIATEVVQRVGFPHRRASTSSQDEYEESESDEDPIMSSSTEQVTNFPRILPITQGVGSDSDDENATALGKVSDEPIFTPQPNAFSHPPSAQYSQRQSVPGSYFPRHPVPQSQQRHSYTNRSTTRTHTPYNTIVPSHQVDHDAALRASLTTLLSCAAAARGLPKRNNETLPTTGVLPGPEITGLRLVPESEVMGPSPANLSPSTRPRSSPSISEQDAASEKGKRKATPSKPSLPTRATKKKKINTVEEALISPTLFTWVFSAGVVVLVSVMGFGAGYAIGREVGRQETLSGVSETTSCGKEALRSVSEIRKFRWGNGKGIVA